MKPLHFSALRHMAKSPAHYKANLELGRADTPAMRIGRLVHTLVLGGPRLVVWDGTRRGKDFEKFRTENDGAEIATRDEYEQAAAMAAAVNADKHAHFLLDGTHELAFSWEIAGRPCAGRCDVLGMGGDYVAELKTTTDADPGRFARNAAKMAYPAQLDWYANGLRAAKLADPATAFIIAVENKPPYVVTTFEVVPHALEIGRRTWRAWFERLLVCESADYWPGYVQDIYPLDVPEDEFEIGGEEAA